ncbi:MAG TPA: hypothetical protein PKN08_05365, partial [Opitutaceae bacterium]|nr:hypothetical protein [Opitutaceae bacterium]
MEVADVEIGGAGGGRQLAVRLEFFGDREVEFTILQHFGPDAAVDAAAEVFDELSVDVRVDGRRGGGGVELHGRRRLGSAEACAEQKDGEQEGG